MSKYQDLIDQFYPLGSQRREIYTDHCRKVTNLALEISQRLHLPLDDAQIEEAGMLHDIGIFLTNAPTLDCHGKDHYLLHGVLGATLLRHHGFSEATARVAERHTGTGLTLDDMSQIPALKDFTEPLMPQTQLEKLICYADKFYSKSGSMEKKSLAQARASVARYGHDSARRFDNMHAQFGS